MTRAEAIARAALDREVAAVASCGEGGRSLQTFKSAAALGQLVGAGVLDRENVEALLVQAAVQAGLLEREALGHVRRGMRAGEAEPRALPQGDGRPGRSGAAAPPPIQRRPEPSYARPPADEVEALWESALSVESDDEVATWLCDRRGLDPADVAAWDVARAMAQDAILPTWARCGRTAWDTSGHRLLVRLFDAKGAFVSLRARCVRETELKSLAPEGFQVMGAVMADPLAREVLRGAAPDVRRFVVVEGEMDLLAVLASTSDANENAPAMLAVDSGAWTRELAARIPSGATVAVWTHADPTGDVYAVKVAATLGARCDVRRGRWPA